MQAFKHVVNVLAEVFVGPAYASRNIKLTLQFIRRHKATVMTSSAPRSKRLSQLPRPNSGSLMRTDQDQGTPRQRVLRRCPAWP